MKPINEISTSRKLSGKAWQPWKQKIEKINAAIANEGNFVQVNNFYDLYDNFEKL